MSDGLDRRSSVFRDLMQAMPKSNSNVIEETIDGNVYRYMPEPRCRVCSADEARKGLINGRIVRNLVDDLLLYPKSMKEVLFTIEPLMETWAPKYKISYKSIRTHMKKHLAWDRLAMRMMVEKWAQEKGIPILDAANRMILTEEAFLEATAHMGWQSMLRGDIEPSWGETQKAFERMADIQKQAEGEYSITNLLAQLNTVIQIIREEIPTDRWPKVLEKLEGKERPVLPSTSEKEDILSEIQREQEQLSRENND